LYGTDGTDVNIPGEVSQSIASSSGSLLLLSFLQKTHEYHTSKTISTLTTASRTGYPPLTRRTLRMSSTYRQVEESRAASRVGSRAGSPAPGQGQSHGGRGGGRLRLVEERIETAQASAGRIPDVNEQVFRELKRRGNERAERLGAVWLDGVSVSFSGGISQLVQQRLMEAAFEIGTEPRSDDIVHVDPFLRLVILASDPYRHMPLSQPGD
jgi:hypothetical protein